MKANIHPKYNTKAAITCNGCSTVYELGSTENAMKVELCSNCHPFYTGKEILVDTDNLIELYNQKVAKASGVKLVKKKEKRAKVEKAANKPLSLKDMLSSIK